MFIKIISDPVVVIAFLLFSAILAITAICYIREYKVKLKVTLKNAPLILFLVGSLNIPCIIFLAATNQCPILNILSLMYVWYLAGDILLKKYERS